MKKIRVCLFLLYVVYPLIFLSGMILCFTTCKNIENGQNEDKQEINSTAAPLRKEHFAMPIIPDSLKEPTERAAYLVIHYWDNFDFADTTYMHQSEVTEQAFANYIEVLPHTEQRIVEASIKTLLDKTCDEQTQLMYPYFCELFKKYLYEPNSPLRNDEFYIPVVQYIIADSVTQMADKERARFALAMMSKNRIGEKAVNFTYTLASDKMGNMHAINGEFTLLLFYNPDCHACEEMIENIKTSPILSRLIANKTLTILSFYPDADTSIWKKHLSDIPTTWINGYDKQQIVQSKKLYDLKAIPSLYLLDKNKKVILKDSELVFVETYLNNNK